MKQYVIGGKQMCPFFVFALITDAGSSQCQCPSAFPFFWQNLVSKLSIENWIKLTPDSYWEDRMYSGNAIVDIKDAGKLLPQK